MEPTNILKKNTHLLQLNFNIIINQANDSEVVFSLKLLQPKSCMSIFTVITLLA
jgi:hypothetical protein